MNNSKRIIILFCLCLIAACSHTNRNKPTIDDIASANPVSFVQIAYAGIMTEVNISKEVQITKVLPDSPADRADLRINDVILSIDDVGITSHKQMRKLLMIKNPSEIVLFKIRRNNNVSDRKVTLGKRHMIRDQYILMQSDKPIRLVILAGDISTAYNVNQGWQKGIENQMITSAENMYVNLFSQEKDCMVIDRATVSKIQDEFKFQQGGYVSDEFRVKLGKMFGATHILILSFSRFRSSAYGWQDINYRKLIDVESGKILASIAIKDI